MAAPTDNAVGLTGDARIDGLTQGSAWRSGSGTTVISYSLSLNDTASGGPWQEWYAAYVREALRQWSNVANVSFVEAGSGTVFTGSTADIAITLTGNELAQIGANALAVFPSPTLADQFLAETEYDRSAYPRPEGDIFLDNYIGPSRNPGNRGYTILLHEIGHALGLKHSADDGGSGRPTFAQLGIADLDNTDYTIMSANNLAFSETSHNPLTPMVLDVLAIQHIYGANTSYRTGDDVYNLRGDPVPFGIAESNYRTIWDAGGNDTIDGSSMSAVTIDLREGSVNNRVGIAYGTTIENAIGSSSSDTLIGNHANNHLDGRGGADTLRGAAGDDTYTVSTAHAKVHESAAEGTDTVVSSRSFTLPDHVENLTVANNATARGNDLNNVLIGGAGRNVLIGGGGDDWLDGGGELDTMYGGPGNDTYVVDPHYQAMPATGAVVWGEAGSFPDMLRVFNPADSQLYTQPAPQDHSGDGVPETLYIRWLGASDSFSFNISTRYLGHNLQPGRYENAAPGFWGEPGRAGLDFSTGQRVVGGSFTIHEIEFYYGFGTPQLTRLSVDFESRQESYDGYGTEIVSIFGRVRFNTTAGALLPESVIELPNEGTDTVRVSRGYSMPDNVENAVITGTSDAGVGGNASANYILGNANANPLSGFGGNDTLAGGGGDDILEGGANNDHLAGDAGTDTARYSAPRAAYTVRERDGVVTVSGPDGTDRLTGVEWLQFSDMTVLTPRGRQLDLDGDNGDDIVLRHTNGTLGLWQMEGNRPATQSYHDLAGWTLADAQSDFNGDRTSDLLLRNGDGHLRVMTMNGTQVTGDVTLPLGVDAVRWSVVESGADFNGDGRNDLLLRTQDTLRAVELNGTFIAAQNNFHLPGWRVLDARSDYNGDGKSDVLLAHADGRARVWYMNGAAIGTEFDSVPLPPGLSPLEAVGTRLDFNADGRNDILWRSGDQTQIWLMGTVGFMTHPAPIATPGWRLIESRIDLNADGRNDLVWRHTDGSIRFWQMSGYDIAAQKSYTTSPGWKIADTRADFNGDGKGDLLLRNDNGMIGLWQMNGTQVAAQSYYTTSPGWNIADSRVDFNGDGRSDVLLRNDDGMVGFWLLDGTRIASQTYYTTSPGWKIADAQVDFNADGRNDLVWRNSIDNMLGFWQMDGGAIAQQTYLTTSPGWGMSIFSDETKVLSAGMENLTLTGPLAIDGTGNAASNTIVGNDAANRLDGGAGADTLRGNGGDDTYLLDSAADVVIEEAEQGTDSVFIAATYTLTPEVENLTLTGVLAYDGTGNARPNFLVGTGVGNILRGEGGDDNLFGGGGMDSLYGGPGNDIFDVDSSGDVVWEFQNEGTDTVYAMATYTITGHVENLTLTGVLAYDATGNGLDNVITGNVVGNILTGGGGNDTLVGAGGMDSLIGDAGSDVFDYNQLSEGGDVIRDFAAGAGGDALDLRDLLTGYVPGVSNKAAFVTLLQSGGNTAVAVDADGAGGDFVTMAMLRGVTGLVLDDMVAQGNLILG